MSNATIRSAAVYIVKVKSGSDWLTVRVEDADGCVGLGDASQSQNNDAVVGLLQNVVFPALVGTLAESGHSFCRRLRHRLLPWGTSNLAVSTAVSAIEVALMDLRARQLEVPLFELLGGKIRDEIALYANLNRGVADRSAEEYATLAARASTVGFRAVKLAPFIEVDPNGSTSAGIDRDVRPGLQRVEAVLASAANCSVLVDCHGRFTSSQALLVGRELERLGVGWVEDPVWPTEDLHGLARVTDALDIAVASGESLEDLSGFGSLLRTGAADVVMPDVKHCGGLHEALKIAALAEGFGLEVSPHNPSGPVGTLASAHLCAVIPNFCMLEYPFDEVHWRNELSGDAEAVQDGRLVVSGQPGLGLSWDPKEDVRAELVGVGSRVGAGPSER